MYIDRKAEGDYVLGLHNSFNPQFESDILKVCLPDIKKFAEQLQSFCPGTIKRRAEKNDSGLDAIDIIGKVITNLLRKEIKEKNCSVLLTQEMADHIYNLYLNTEDIDRVDLPFPDGQEFSKELLDRHVGEYIWIEIFGDPVPDIFSLNELPKEFKLTFADHQTEVSLDSLFELFDDASFGSIIMDVYYAIYLQKKNNMPDSEIVQILSKAILA